MKTSIIMTSFNYEKFIAQAIESVIKQTVSDWELIIIDDGSTDNSLNIIKSYVEKDERIKLTTHPNHENRGLCASVRLGIEKAQNEWVAFLESDDFWAENYLEEKTKFIEKYPKIVLIYNDVECFGDKNKPDSYFERLKNLWKNKEVQNVFDHFGTENIVPTFSCVMCKKETLLTCDINPKCKPLLDYWLWWQMAEKGDFGYVNKKLAHWRLHKNSYLNDFSSTFEYTKNRYSFIYNITKILNKGPKLSVQNKFEKFLPASIIIYCFVYLKKQSIKFFKNLFIAR